MLVNTNCTILFFIRMAVSSVKNVTRAVARTLIGGGCILIYSGYARLTSFEINFILKETSRAEPEYMNIHPPPPINVLATALNVTYRANTTDDAV